jgi:uncharacterized protein (TIGR02596 family)
MAHCVGQLLSAVALNNMPSLRLDPIRTSRRGFTLLELMVVMAIIAILSTLALPGLQGMISSSNLKGSADSVAAEFDLARQYASTRNLPVEVRLYQDTSRAKDINGNYPYRYIAIAIPASISTAASDEFLTQPIALPGDVIVDSNTQYSTLLNPALGASGLQPVSGSELSSAPSVVQGKPYIKFMYLANGTINLDPTQQWCLTLYNQNKSAHTGPNGAPTANFITFILDVQTGKTRVYQP